MRGSTGIGFGRQPPHLGCQPLAKAVAGRERQAQHGATGCFSNGALHEAGVGTAAAKQHLVAVAHTAKQAEGGVQQRRQHGEHGLVHVVHFVHAQRTHPQRPARVVGRHGA